MNRRSVLICIRICLLFAIGFKLSKAQSNYTSDDPNYAGMVQIQKIPALKVYYKVVTTDSGGPALTIKAVYEALAWLGIGVSSSGSMIGGEAIIGQPSAAVSNINPGKYILTAQDASGVNLGPAQTLINGSITQDASTTTLEFTKLLEESGEIPITSTGLNTFIYAAGTDNTFPAYHQYRNSFQLDLSGATVAVIPTEGSGSTTKNYAKIFAAHGIVAVIAWAFLTPFAVASAFLRSMFTSPVWFKIHMYLNITSYLLTSTAFILAITSIAPNKWFSKSHFIGGWFLMGLATLQVVAGALRPHPDKLDEPKTVPQVVTNWFGRAKAGSVRATWEASHKFVGFGLVALSLWQMQSGLKLWVAKYGTSDYLLPFWDWIICLFIAIFFVKIFAFRNWKKSRPTDVEAMDGNNEYEADQAVIDAVND